MKGIESYPKMYFLLNLSQYVKLWAFMSNFGIFYDARSPNMAMSHYPRSKFRKKLFFLILHLILGKVTKFLAEKFSASEVISQKPHGQGGGLCLSESVYKTCQRQPTELKFGKLIFHSKFHKISKFENHVTRKDVIMTNFISFEN